MYLLGLLLAAVGVGYVYMGYDDGFVRLWNSHPWCENMKDNVPWVTHPDNVHCKDLPFIMVAVMDFLCALFFFVLSFLSICFVCKAGPGRGHVKSGRLLPEDNNKDEPDDRFGVPEEEETPKSASGNKSGGGFFNFFGAGKKAQQRVPDEEPEEGGPVNFEKESRSRFAPMSKTDKEAAKDLPLGHSNSGAPASQAVGNDLFNFDDMGTTAKPAPQTPTQPAVEQQQAQPVPQAEPEQPKPQAKASGEIDFEALAGNDGNPF